MPKFFVTREDIQGNYIIIHKDVHHILHVLRKSKGDTLEVCDGKNTDYVCEILEISRGEDQIICKVLSKVTSKSEADVKVCLYQGLPKADKMELILQKGTEIGAYEFIPFESERTVVHLDSKKSNAKLERWNKIAESAAKQSGRGNIPRVRNVLDFKGAVADAAKNCDLVLVCYDEEVYGDLNGMTLSIFLLILLTLPAEVKQILEGGGHAVTLGPRILRTETAGMIATALILYEYDQMN